MPLPKKSLPILLTAVLGLLTTAALCLLLVYIKKEEDKDFTSFLPAAGTALFTENLQGTELKDLLSLLPWIHIPLPPNGQNLALLTGHTMEWITLINGKVLGSTDAVQSLKLPTKHLIGDSSYRTLRNLKISDSPWIFLNLSLLPQKYAPAGFKNVDRIAVASQTGETLIAFLPKTQEKTLHPVLSAVTSPFAHPALILRLGNAGETLQHAEPFLDDQTRVIAESLLLAGASAQTFETITTQEITPLLSGNSTTLSLAMSGTLLQYVLEGESNDPAPMLTALHAQMLAAIPQVKHTKLTLDRGFVVNTLEQSPTNGSRSWSEAGIVFEETADPLSHRLLTTAISGNRFFLGNDHEAVVRAAEGKDLSQVTLPTLPQSSALVLEGGGTLNAQTASQFLTRFFPESPFLPLVRKREGPSISWSLLRGNGETVVLMK